MVTLMLLLTMAIVGAAGVHTPKTTTDKAKANPSAQVVLHPRTMIYHCASIKVPYTVKDGQNMTQAQAIAKGARAQQNRFCL